ncbi:acetylornithine deacetylase [Alsobacter metallidurans]|uniref:Acetylornithine deacetylase n=1 Tax=Alsobacter metallidurans TaxID=340221 RepID=A0A917I3W6_9HYPH|nr:acetylornithine deacetylase [Alsobacter metallidurans]GGH07713.1 acetylornithine deacetylase [Alsobacter metallidurans]
MLMTPREMLARLVAFPTVSRDSNLDCIHFIRDYLAAHGVESRLVPNEAGDKANLYATIGPAEAGGVVLSGHTDVVPVDGQHWSSDPFTLTERDGKLYGRGTCDMKGFDALALAHVPEMLAAGLRRPIHIALSYDEEVGCQGAISMVDEMAASIPTPSAVIVGEPSRMRMVNGHKGSVSFFTTVRGRTVHSSRIDTGVSATMVAARLVTWHDDVMEENKRRADPANPFEPPYTTLHCGFIRGGTAANVVADRCEFVSEVRAIPTDDPWSYKQRFEAYVRDVIEPRMRAVAPETGVDIIHRASVNGLKPEIDGQAERLVRRLTGDNATAVVSYGTEAGLFQKAGWSTVVCGPGDIAQAHQADEFLEISELEKGAAFMRRLIAELAS